jgi:hypothetical protein
VADDAVIDCRASGVSPGITMLTRRAGSVSLKIVAGEAAAPPAAE